MKTKTPVQRLRALRKRKRWDQSEAATRIGVKTRTLRSWEQGTRSPKPIVQKAILEFIAESD
ncbi:MAG TPA: helix-turn-helix transcriptional regulator [Verrucomicrobiae bacterium]|nr:helix-turn-helix transcriptional regulator [Verrucomicrobiae bacterium]